MLITYLMAFMVILLDQAFKFWVAQSLPYQASVPFIPHTLDLYYLHNEGAGWGFFQGRTSFLVGISLLAIAYLAYLIWKHQDGPLLLKLAYALLIGGAAGNLIDRLVHGYVIDMLRVLWFDFPIFNLADAALSLGVLLLIILVVWKEEGSEWI